MTARRGHAREPPKRAGRARRARPTAGRASSSSTSGSTRSWSTRSCTCRSWSSWCSRSTARTGSSTKWGGISIKWFQYALADEVVLDALKSSFIVAIPNAVLATVFGTMAALGLQRVGKRVRLGFDTLTYMSVIVPEIVIALSTLVLFATGFDWIKSTFGVKFTFGYPTIIAAHVLFNLSLVLLLVRARLSGWTARSSTPAPTSSPRRGGRSARSRSRSSSRRSSRGSCCRSRSASTTT